MAPPVSFTSRSSLTATTGPQVDIPIAADPLEHLPSAVHKLSTLQHVVAAVDARKGAAVVQPSMISSAAPRSPKHLASADISQQLRGTDIHIHHASVSASASASDSDEPSAPNARDTQPFDVESKIDELSIQDAGSLPPNHAAPGGSSGLAAGSSLAPSRVPQLSEDSLDSETLLEGRSMGVGAASTVEQAASSALASSTSSPRRTGRMRESLRRLVYAPSWQWTAERVEFKPEEALLAALLFLGSDEGLQQTRRLFRIVCGRFGIPRRAIDTVCGRTLCGIHDMAALMKPAGSIPGQLHARIADAVQQAATRGRGGNALAGADGEEDAEPAGGAMDEGSVWGDDVPSPARSAWSDWMPDQSVTGDGSPDSGPFSQHIGAHVRNSNTAPASPLGGWARRHQPAVSAAMEDAATEAEKGTDGQGAGMRAGSWSVAGSDIDGSSLAGGSTFGGGSVGSQVATVLDPAAEGELMEGFAWQFLQVVCGLAAPELKQYAQAATTRSRKCST